MVFPDPMALPRSRHTGTALRAARRWRSGAFPRPAVQPAPPNPPSLRRQCDQIQPNQTTFFGKYPDHLRLLGERDRLGRIRRRPADGTLRNQQAHPFGGSSCVSLTIWVLVLRANLSQCCESRICITSPTCCKTADAPMGGLMSRIICAFTCIIILTRGARLCNLAEDRREQRCSGPFWL